MAEGSHVTGVGKHGVGRACWWLLAREARTREATRYSIKMYGQHNTNKG
jgi:hypothetical protein